MRSGPLSRRRSPFLRQSALADAPRRRVPCAAYFALRTELHCHIETIAYTKHTMHMTHVAIITHVTYMTHFAHISRMHARVREDTTYVSHLRIPERIASHASAPDCCAPHPRAAPQQGA